MENIKVWMHFANKKTKKIFSYVNDQVLFNLHVFTDLRGEGGICAATIKQEYAF